MDTNSDRSEELAMPRVLQDLADGRLGPDEVDAVVAWLATHGEPPSWLVNRAVRIGRPAADARPSAWRRVVAVLVRDSRLDPAAAGTRGVGSGAPRLLYQAGGVEIDLEVTRSDADGRICLLGQVTAHAADLNGAWAVAEGPGGRAEADLDDAGQFVLAGLEAGPHRLEIGLNYELIEIPDLQL